MVGGTEEENVGNSGRKVSISAGARAQRWLCREPGRVGWIRCAHWWCAKAHGHPQSRKPVARMRGRREDEGGPPAECQLLMGKVTARATRHVDCQRCATRRPRLPVFRMRLLRPSTLRALNISKHRHKCSWIGSQCVVRGDASSHQHWIAVVASKLLDGFLDHVFGSEY